MSPEMLPAFVLTKTEFRRFLECRREFWLRYHHPELIVEPIDASAQFRIRQGYAVERLARRVLDSGSGAMGNAVTRGHGNKGNRETMQPTLFDNSAQAPSRILEHQLAVSHNALAARLDIFDRESRTVYEVKSSKHIPSTHKNKAKQDKREIDLYDLGFQVFVARLSGLKVERAVLATINGAYVRSTDLDTKKLIHFEDVTEEIELIQTDIDNLTRGAFDLIENGPGQNFNNLCTKKLHCPYFEFARPELPPFTIYDIPGLRGERFDKIKATGILAIEDIPRYADLTDNQWTFIHDTLNPRIEKDVKRDEIKELIDGLEYPLYFLDYETVNPAIPQFAGMRGYDQITFQFSVQVQERPGAELVHRKFLSDGNGDLQRALVEQLRDSVGDTGSIISWNESFEKGRNSELANLYPEYESFLTSLNERSFDLALPFQKKLYDDPAIKGWSLKSVQPVLVPELPYEILNISNGGDASARWYMDVFENSDEKEETLRNLRTYCHQDTLVMVRILEALIEEVGL